MMPTTGATHWKGRQGLFATYFPIGRSSSKRFVLNIPSTLANWQCRGEVGLVIRASTITFVISSSTPLSKAATTNRFSIRRLMIGPVRLSLLPVPHVKVGQGDLHCYFWPVAASLLKENGA